MGVHELGISDKHVAFDKMQKRGKYIVQQMMPSGVGFSMILVLNFNQFNCFLKPVMDFGIFTKVLVVGIIKDMYDGVVANVRTCGGITSDFSITIELYQESALSSFLFDIVMDELTRATQDEILWCMLFVDDIVLVDETRESKIGGMEANSRISRI